MPAADLEYGDVSGHETEHNVSYHASDEDVSHCEYADAVSHLEREYAGSRDISDDQVSEYGSGNDDAGGRSGWESEESESERSETGWMIDNDAICYREEWVQEADGKETGCCKGEIVNDHVEVKAAELELLVPVKLKTLQARAAANCLPVVSIMLSAGGTGR